MSDDKAAKKCCHYDEGRDVGFAEGYTRGYGVGGDAALEAHTCDPVHESAGSACVRCGGSTRRRRDIFNGVDIPICGTCDDAVHFDVEQIRSLLRAVLR